MKIFRKIYAFLASAKLAMALLVVILGCCVVGVTLVRGARAGALIFGTMWFNGLLVLLVVNVACCFFPRVWGRKLTMVSLGMIVFHLSFVATLGGVVFNSFYYFRALIRLTEGEVLPNGDLQSYDEAYRGRFFDPSLLKGETTLIRMHRDYKIEEENKRAAYEVAVGEEGARKEGIIYITKGLDYQGFSYFNEKEGYSILVTMADKQGRELYGAHIPLQSLKLESDEPYLYTTGTKEGPGNLPFPYFPAEPLFDLQVTYHPDPEKDRAGKVTFQVWKGQAEHVTQDAGSQENEAPSMLDAATAMHPASDAENTAKRDDVVSMGVSHEQSQGAAAGAVAPLAEGTVAIGEPFPVGDHVLTAREVRYWAGMRVRYEPGKPIVLASLWTALGGIVLTFIGRLRRNRRRGTTREIMPTGGVN